MSQSPSQTSNPSPSRSLFGLRGRVEAHRSHQTGWWIFGETVPTMQVRLHEQDLRVFNIITNNQCFRHHGQRVEGVADVLLLGIDANRLSRFPIGSDIAVVLEYTAPNCQLFLRTIPIRVKSVMLLEPGTLPEYAIGP